MVLDDEFRRKKLNNRQDLITKLGEYLTVENDTKLGQWITSVNDVKFTDILVSFTSLLSEIEAAYGAQLVLSYFSEGRLDDDLCEIFSDTAHERLEAAARLLGFEGCLYY
jgi:hypothetical protein